MRKWIITSVMAALLLTGCHLGKKTEHGQQRENGPQIQSLPVPESAQDQDINGVLFGPPAALTNDSTVSPTPASASPSAEIAVTPDPTASPTLIPTTGPTPAPTAAAKKKPAVLPSDPSSRLNPKAAKQASSGKSKDSAKAHSAKALTLSELRHKYSSSFIFQGSTDKRRIALTFDDAPDTVYTPQVLDILKKHRVKATFFIVGYRAVEHPEVVKRIVREGHVVGNHSYGHSQLKKLSQAKFIQEVEKTERVLAPLAGYTPRLIRPPYGALNDEELAWLSDQGYLTVNWNVDPEDWRGVAKEVVLKRSLDCAGPGSIILMHSATGTGGSLKGTIDALPDLIEGLRGKGYDLVTLPELLQSSKGK
jgi:peptidoglycan-N-acetylglucosamine deacetylase